MFLVDLTFKCYGDVMVFCVFMFIFQFFCLEATLVEDTKMRATSATDLVIFSKWPFRKFPDHNWVNVSSQQLRNNIDNSILKDILQLNVLWIWIKIHANSFIKTWVNTMKRESTNVPWKLSLEKKYDPALQGTLHRNRSYLTCCYTLLLLSY